ncbi:MAG: hypothetical protein ABIK53_06120 [bacterium]
MNRRREIRNLLKLTSEQVIEKSGKHLVVVSDLEKLHNHFANFIASEIEGNNKRNKRTNLILPVGPIGQYPILAEIINQRKICLSKCHFFFMDEYCDDKGYVVPKTHPLSFKGIAERIFLSKLDRSAGLTDKQVIFPDHSNINLLADKIENAGGIDTCYGGIGIHGHVAFNEPELNIKESDPRLVYLNKYTITINAIRAEVGGNLETFPNKAVTLGMRQILGAGHIKLCCRNGTPYDWANTILRIALLGKPGDDYPVTYIRDRDYTIITDEDTLKSPKYVV